ncbi:rrna intron-encoded homing endonuclease [Cucumis melo var. makuwa]|uniref:Rrna intron-encoded homing endonuclease n=1 Tax=Cucumis melo var. makuwa TaxID=1194695 RepID=A0A5A7UA72_CUCMM|nr:rrna intron-encoded homing endonuclease [Cucumis melo var. makuwa]
MGGGAWSFLVGGAICLVNSVNERDLSLLTSYTEIIAIVGLQRGIPSKRESSARVDYVPALCTHRPSLLPIEWSGEVFGSRRCGRFATYDVDPANHRVFECKLRPEPSGRGHVCLGVTHRCPHHTTPPMRGRCEGRGHTLASRTHRHADGLNSSPRCSSSRYYGG